MMAELVRTLSSRNARCRMIVAAVHGRPFLIALMVSALALFGVTSTSANMRESASFGCFQVGAARFERFWGMSDLFRFLTSYSSSDQKMSDEEAQGELGLRHIFFIVKASKAREEYALRMQRAWLHATAFHIFVVDDLLDGIPEHSQVVVRGSDARSQESAGPGDFSTRPRDAVAISRLLIWMHQAKLGFEPGSLPPDMRWVAILGDDVFVNLARLYHFLNILPRGATVNPIAFSHVLSDVVAVDFDAPCIEGGMTVLNRPAFERLAESASCKECPHVGSDDVSLGYCLNYNAIPLVHAPGFHCHTPNQLDDVLTYDMMAHDWVAAGGLAGSIQGGSGRDAGDGVHGQLSAPMHYHPFEADFPNLDCSPFSLSERWTAARLLERAMHCVGDLRPRESKAPRAAAHGDELSAESLDEYFRARWPGQTHEEHLVEVVTESYDAFAMRQALVMSLVDAGVQVSPASSEHATWRFLRTGSTWLHRAEVARCLGFLDASGIMEEPASKSKSSGVCFAFIGPDSKIDLRAGLLLSELAAGILANSFSREALADLHVDHLNALGIHVIHTPWLVPDAVVLPQTLAGMVSEGAVSGVWAVGSASEDVIDSLESKAQSRKFFGGMLREDFEDWLRGKNEDKGAEESQSRGECSKGEASEDGEKLAARSWIRFLHDDDEHIKSVREFKSGRREFRTLHAMYRSEASEGVPLHRIHPDTVLVARDCVK